MDFNSKLIYLFIFYFVCGCQKNKTIAQKCAWNNCPEFPTVGKKDSSEINVHLICHTHDDAGWIVNVDEYYSRLRPELIQIGVEYIFNTVLIELERDSTKRFSFAETAFLTRWIESNSEEDVQRLKKLIINGQIELIGGGWVQPDEAASHYIELIDQYTLGLRKLNDSYGECGIPKIAWQIDPFGHSQEHANLAVNMGYEALFFARMHYLEHEQRLKNKSLEFIWATSPDFKVNQILTGQFYQGNYGPPPEYCFDILCKDKPVVTNPNLQGYNIHEKVDKLITFVKNQVKHQRHQNVMLLMGGDFQYSDANMVFTNIDKLIKYANTKSDKTGVTFRYSTPSCYVKSLSDAGPRLPQRFGDTFPHATAYHSYWTGYFTSKPALKGLIRYSSNYLQLIRILDSFSLFENLDNSGAIEELERAVALSQHHDAVTGTSKENVTKDYETRLIKGMISGQKVLEKSYKKLLNLPNNITVPKQYLCLLTNESICTFTKILKKAAITVYNSHTVAINTVIKIPYYYDTVSIKDTKGNYVDFDIKKSFIPKNQFVKNDTALFELQIPVDIPALGFKTLYISREKKNTDRTTITFRNEQKNEYKKVKKYSTTVPPTVSSTTSSTSQVKINNNTKILSNKIIELTFDNGKIVKIKNLKDNFTLNLQQEFLYYESKRKSFKFDQSSGAYIFRPNSTAKVFNDTISVEFLTGKYLQEVRQVINPWISQVIRLYPNQSFVEFDWIIGPIFKEKKNPIGKEIITRYTVKDIKNSGKFYTDSNGRQMMERIRNKANYHTFEKTEEISGNYYPVPSRIQISDDKNQMTILTDRSQGGTSLLDGTIELMLHRRMYEDDNFGVEEALDEPGDDKRGLITRGKHWLILENLIGQKKHRKLGLKMFHEPIITYSKINQNKDLLLEFSGLLKSLPENVHLLTLKQLNKNSVLLRLEHFYQNEQKLALAQPVVVDLDQIFSTLDVLSAEELLLAGNLKTGDKKDLPSSWNRSTRILKGSGKERFSIELKPMEIKTLLLEVKFKNHQFNDTKQ